MNLLSCFFRFFFSILFFIFFLTACKKVKKEYYDNGNIKSEVEIINNKRNGLFKEYYETGQLKSVTNWEEDLQNGQAVFYFKSGKINSISMWRDNKLDSISKIYYENGQLENEAKYIKGKLDGNHVSYYPNGKLRQKGFFKKGISHGILTNYYDNPENRISSVDHILNIKGQEKNMGFIEYNLDGTIKSSSTRVILEAVRDTIKLDELLELKIIVDSPKYDSTILIIGAFNEDFDIEDTSKTDTIKFLTNNLIYTVKPLKKGIQYVRGVVKNSGIVEKNSMTSKIAVIDRYFEHSFFVK